MLLLFLLTACSRVLHLTSVQPQTYALDSGEGDSVAWNMIGPYKSSLDSQMNVIIGHCSMTLTKNKPESTLSNWMCDALVRQARLHTGHAIDFAAMNYGGIRINEIPPGPVTVGKIYELMPFDNMVVILEGDGSVVKEFMDYMAGVGGLPVSGDVQFEIRDGKATRVTIGGEPLNPDRKYAFAVPDYVANGGDNIPGLSGLPRFSPDMLVRDALIMEVKSRAAAGESISAELDGRIR